MKNILFIILYLSTINLFSQNFFEENRDTTFVRDDFQISLIYISDSLSCEKIWQTQREGYQNPVITNQDSIRDILKKNLVSKTFRWDNDSISYLSELVCENGFRIFLNGDFRELRYYPIENIVSVGNLSASNSGIFYLTDGMLTYLPEYMSISSNKMFRWGVLDMFGYDSEERYNHILEVYDAKLKEYRRLFNLTSILSESALIIDVGWLDDVYYFYDDRSRTWKIDVQQIKK